MNGEILKSQKLLAELTIELYILNQQQNSEINYPMNVVSYAQIAYKKHIFQARSAIYHNMLIQCMWICWSCQVSMGNLALSFRSWDYSSILCVAVSPIHKYRSEPSL